MKKIFGLLTAFALVGSAMAQDGAAPEGTPAGETAAPAHKKGKKHHDKMAHEKKHGKHGKKAKDEAPAADAGGAMGSEAPAAGEAAPPAGQ